MTLTRRSFFSWLGGALTAAAVGAGRKREADVAWPVIDWNAPHVTSTHEEPEPAQEDAHWVWYNVSPNLSVWTGHADPPPKWLTVPPNVEVRILTNARFDDGGKPWLATWGSGEKC